MEKFSFVKTQPTIQVIKEDAEQKVTKERASEDLAQETEDINANVFDEIPTKEVVTDRKRARIEEDELKVDEMEDLQEIEKKVDLIIEELMLESPSHQETHMDTIKYKLDYILKNVKVSRKVNELEQVVKEVKAMTLSKADEKLVNEKEEVEHEKENVYKILLACKNIAEIESKVPEFHFQEEKEKMICSVCNSEFHYDNSIEVGRKQPRTFLNLKQNLQNHLKKSATHKTALGHAAVQDKIAKKEETRNEKCGMNLARTAYHILSNGRPTSDFTELISMQHSNGCDVGDINHSFHFVTNMAGSFSTVITERVKKHLSSRLLQTGCLPPCKVVEDGATYKHDTRLLIGLNTVFPGSKPLIQSVFCGAPKGIRADGASIAEAMFKTVIPFISPVQYLGTSEDGANFLAHVGEHLDKLMGVDGHHDWDGVHASATIDTALRNPKKEWAEAFAWILDIINTISKTFRFINWGMEWARFCKTVKAMIEEGYDLKCKVPRFFSETRFANYASKVYTRFRESYPVLIACLEEVKGLYFTGKSDEKNKAEKADELLSSIYNVKFSLNLAVLCDVYNIYSQISVLLQKVSTLPHTRYDQFKELLEDYIEMLDHVDIKLCPCATFRNIQDDDYSIADDQKVDAGLVCSWPTLHTDIATLKETGKIVHVIQGQLVADPVKDTRIGRRKKEATKLLREEDIIKAVEKRATSLVTHLSSRLESKVFREKDIKVIKNTRVLLSTRNLMLSVGSRGASTVSNLTWEKFLSSSVEVDPTLLQRTSEEEYRLQFREYVRRLETIARDPSRRELSDLELLELFLHPDNVHLYQDIEAVLSVMVRGALLISVESVVESWISTMEHHSSQRRNIGEMLLHEEMVIAINGPSLVHCESISQEALHDYFKDSSNPKDRAGHFVKRSQNVKNYLVSKSVDILRKQEPKNICMV